MADSADRNLPASERKKSKAREQGQVARSRDLGHFAAVAIGGALLVAVTPQLAAWLRQILVDGLRFDARMLASPGTMLDRFSELGWKMLVVVLPAGAVMGAVGAACAVVSGGWNFTLQAIEPNFGKFNPIAGLGRLFSKSGLTETLKACFLALVLGTIGYFHLRAQAPVFTETLAMPLPAAIDHAVHAILEGLIQLVIALGVFAAIDVPLQRWLLANRLKMSHTEVKQEYKDAEGNSEVKAKIKVRMREMARKRMLQAVPQADLVVMNPTHYAVALKYDDATMAAPRVIAKGVDLLALRIRDIATENEVPVLEAPPLARALYAHAEIDSEIPAALFSAVAQVLAYVYQLRAAMSGRGAMPGNMPDLPVPAELDPHHRPAGAA